LLLERWLQRQLSLSQTFLWRLPLSRPSLPATAMSWKRAQTHAESMLENLGLPPTKKGRKDLRGKRLVLVDDGLSPYRTMCFTVAAKIVRRRGGDVETVKPAEGEPSHAKIIDAPVPQPGPRQATGQRPPTGHAVRSRKAPYPR
jgi:hypothetical protein